MTPPRKALQVAYTTACGSGVCGVRGHQCRMLRADWLLSTPFPSYRERVARSSANWPLEAAAGVLNRAPEALPAENQKNSKCVERHDFSECRTTENTDSHRGEFVF